MILLRKKITRRYENKFYTDGKGHEPFHSSGKVAALRLCVYENPKKTKLERRERKKANKERGKDREKKEEIKSEKKSGRKVRVKEKKKKREKELKSKKKNE